LDEAIAAYDQAARRDLDKRDTAAAFQAGYNAATIEKERRGFLERQPPLSQPFVGAHRAYQAADAHLLAVHCMPNGPSSSSLPSWMSTRSCSANTCALGLKAPPRRRPGGAGTAAEHQRDWSGAILSLRNVKADQPQFARRPSRRWARAYNAKLAELHAKGGAS